MLCDDALVLSVDDHVIEHPTVWEDRLPARHREAGPRIVEVEGEQRAAFGVTTTGKQQAWLFEGRIHPQIGLNAVAGKDPAEYGTEPVRFEEMRPGCYDVRQRVEDMDVDGVQAQLCFPSFPGFCGSTFFRAKDKDLALECVKAWNDFMIDEWVAAAPDRFIPLAMVPFWDVEQSVEEVARVASKGALAISFTESPHGLKLPSFHSDHWDPLMAAVQEAELPLCLHFGSGGAPSVAPDANFAVSLALFGTNSQFATVDLLLSPVFVKFPRLKVALSEGGIGWMPYILERTDHTWERHRWHTGLGDTRPSELFREHIFGCYISDDAGIEARHRIGVENIMVETDYPHSDSNWPNNRRHIAEALADVPDEEARMIAEGNARRLFRFHGGQ